MYRSGVRRCPLCDVLLEPHRVSNGVELDRCTRCGGVFLDFFDGDPRTHAGEVLAREVEHTNEGRCAECASPMVLTPFLGDGPMLYRCGACASAFVTPQQAQALLEFSEDEPDSNGGWWERLKALFSASSE